MEKQHKFSIWYVLVAVWIVLIIQNLITQTFSVEHIPYSAFIKALETGKISEVAITQDQIPGSLVAVGTKSRSGISRKGRKVDQKLGLH